jgi:DNA-binding MarR family transcriptional regulator
MRRSTSERTAAKRHGAEPTDHEKVSQLVVAVRRANVVLEAASLVARGELGIGRTDIVTLELLSMGRLSAGDIAEQLGISTGTVTGVVDRLIEVGYASRRTDPHDRRRTLISITPKGRRRFRDAFRARWQWLHQVASDMSAEDVARVVWFLSRMREFMPEHWRSDLAEIPAVDGIDRPSSTDNPS